ncbi:MAG: HNH endonuclease signature motif containing protein [Malacoplasma sp.]
MSLKDKYVEMCNDHSALIQYSETGTGKYGKIFDFQNTNYRLLNSFITNYNTFKDGTDGVNRSEWEHNKSHGQENLKQHTNNMIKSRFFSKNERTYYKTRKGEILEKIPEDFSEEEKWIIVYLLLVDAYFVNIPNYILKRTKEIYEDFLVYENSVDNINYMITEFINASKSNSIEELFKTDYIYFDTFFLPFNNFDFLSNYINSSKGEKQELYEYIINSFEEYKKLRNLAKGADQEALNAKTIVTNYRFECCLTKKYQSSGVFNKNMIVDNAKILFISEYINKNIFRDFRDYIYAVVEKYSQIENINSGKIFQFIFGECKDVFEMCYLNIFNPNYFDDVSPSENFTVEQEDVILLNAENTTVIENIDEVTKVSSILKRKALERANYKCELEDFCQCSSHYFTNKKNGKNYVELHHLIPREFSNDFDKSIELIENYVSLCPRCHRFIHFAVDRERKMVLNYLFNKRMESLEFKGIHIEEKQLKSYYRIEE